MNLAIEGNIDDYSIDIESLLRQMAPVHAAVPRHAWKVQCGGCRYLGPWAAAVLASAYFAGVQRGQRPRIRLPAAPPALGAFCRFSGMTQVFEKGEQPDLGHPDNETAPVERFNEANWNLPDPIIRLLKRHVAELDPEVEDWIRTCIREVTQNTIDHSQSPIGGVMAARYLAASREVRVGIVDRGVGIAESLSTRVDGVTRAFDALRRVVQGGYSSRSRANNLGQGISNLFLLVRLARGRICLFSDDGVASSQSGSEPSIRTLDFRFPGTAVFFALPTDAP